MRAYFYVVTFGSGVTFWACTYTVYYLPRSFGIVSPDDNLMVNLWIEKVYKILVQFFYILYEYKLNLRILTVHIQYLLYSKNILFLITVDAQ